MAKEREKRVAVTKQLRREVITCNSVFWSL
jgi:hypothetical protein